jgi:ABC-type antimicrobial peptide transport system permease subunit
VLSDGLLPLAIGAAAGIAIAFGSEHMVSGLLFQVSPYDPVLSAGAVGVLLAVGTIACLLPARRAAAVEPMQALRTEWPTVPRISVKVTLNWRQIAKALIEIR